MVEKTKAKDLDKKKKPAPKTAVKAAVKAAEEKAKPKKAVKKPAAPAVAAKKLPAKKTLTKNERLDAKLSKIAAAKEAARARAAKTDKSFVQKPAVAPATAAPAEKPKVETRPPVDPAKKFEAHAPAKPAEAPVAAAAPAKPEMPSAPPVTPAPVQLKTLEFEVPISVKDLATRLRVRANELILRLMSKNVLATINQNLGEDVVIDLLKEYAYEYRKPKKAEDQIGKEHRELEETQDMAHVKGRSPVVTFMGHVDHGKTSLLDFIRKTRVADKEKGGITQHIGAYQVKLPKGSVTFLDTPGHQAFTAMRARGANATDVVVLVVAADDGVMPQTKEAIDHARAAKVPIVVALNKCDLPGANIDKVKGQLSQIGLSPEDWGGKTICVPVSAKTGEGVDNLLEMLVLESELLELKANPNLRARGVVIEGKLSSGQGPVATILVKNGTLRNGDMVVSGMHYGRVKAMMDDKGGRIIEAGPSKPVSILGLSGVPMAGDEFFVVKDEKKARTLSVLKQDEDRQRKLLASKRITLEDFYKKMKDGVAKDLAIVIKGDVQGSIEALQHSLLELNTKDVSVNLIHADVGNINESDVMLSMVSNSVIIGFNVKVDDGAAELAAKEGIEIKMYGIIYEAIQDVVAAMEGLLEPALKENFVGRAQVRQVFKVTKAGTIAGSYVLKGKIVRNGIAKLVRDKKVVYEGKIASLKRFKDDARDVAEGFECGIGLDRHDDIKVGDLIEIYQIEKVARRLESRRD
jgi:translation initiation factor IF-2